MTTRKRIYVIRHGQTDWNVEGRWQGTTQISLNVEGQGQAQALAKYLYSRPITSIYSSDLDRARQTAEALGEVLGLPVQLDPRWRELNLGVLQGLTRPEMTERYPDELVGMRDNYFDHIVREGESRRAMQKRAFEALQEIAALEGEGEIAIFTHGGLIRVLLLRMFDADDEMMQKPIDNTSLTTLEAEGGNWYLIDAAETPHLNVAQTPDVDGM